MRLTLAVATDSLDVFFDNAVFGNSSMILYILIFEIATSVI
jgi:hypothetical protein